MYITAELPVDSGVTREDIWSILSDIDHAVDNISSIEKIDILEPSPKKDSLVGLKWEETRSMFGQEAKETMWITESVENEYYKTRAESHGCIYVSTMFIREGEQEGAGEKQLYVGMSFDGQAQSCCAKVMMVLTGWMVKGATRKCLVKDLEDIKAAAKAIKKRN